MIVSVDLSTFSRWSSIEAGEHSITVKARGSGYTTSDASAAVTVTKP